MADRCFIFLLEKSHATPFGGNGMALHIDCASLHLQVLGLPMVNFWCVWVYILVTIPPSVASINCTRLRISGLSGTCSFT